MLHDPSKCTAAFVQLRPEAWGDGLEHVRVLRGWKRAYPESVIYHVARAQNTDAIGAQLLYEGLTDATVTVEPQNFADESMPDAQESNEYRAAGIAVDKLSALKLHTAIFSRHLMQPNLLIGLFPAKYVMSVHGSEDLFERLLNPPPEYKEDYLRETQAMTLEESLAPVRACYLPDRPTVGIFPFSTRPYSTVSSSVWRMIVLHLLSLRCTVMLLGKFTPTWLPNGEKRAHWDTLGAEFRAAVFDLSVINTLGFSSIKQTELVRDCRFVITTMTGSIMLPLLYDVPTLMLEAGDNRIAASLFTGAKRQGVSARTTCVRFPCSQTEMLPWCNENKVPKCLTLEEFNWRAFVEATNYCLGTPSFELEKVFQ